MFQNVNRGGGSASQSGVIYYNGFTEGDTQLVIATTKKPKRLLVDMHVNHFSDSNGDAPGFLSYESYANQTPGCIAGISNAITNRCTSINLKYDSNNDPLGFFQNDERFLSLVGINTPGDGYSGVIFNCTEFRENSFILDVIRYGAYYADCNINWTAEF